MVKSVSSKHFDSYRLHEMQTPFASEVGTKT